MDGFDETMKSRAKSLFIQELEKIVPSGEIEIETTPESKRKYGLFPPKKKSKRSITAAEMVEEYISAYLDDESEPSDLFNFMQRFPYIYKLFVKYNTTLPSSASVERLFSHAGLVMRKNCQSLSDKNFEQHLLLKLNHEYYSLL